MLLHKGTVTLENSDLLLRKFEKQDTIPMFKNWATEEIVTRYLTWRPHQNLKVTEDLITSWCSHYTETTYQWAIVLKELGEPIGSIGIVTMNEETKSADFGYCIGSKYWGRGIVTQAMNILLDYWFNEIGFEKIYGLHHIENLASGRVMQKVGMTYVGILSNEMRDNNGNLIDCAKYEITKDSFNSLCIRKAYTHEDVLVGESYDSLTDYLATHENKCGWSKGCYPTLEVATEGKAQDALYVAVKSGKIAGSVILNHNQAPEYAQANWSVKTNNPLIVHTLAVTPEFFKQGIAQSLLLFAEDFAKKEGSPSIRLDTSEINTPAIALYEKMGYKSCGKIDLGLNRGGIKAWYTFEKEIV